MFSVRQPFTRAITSLITLLFFVTSAAWAQSQFKVLHAFGSTGDGSGPWGQLRGDRSGNLYGTTIYGGMRYGTVFELSPSGSTWNEAILYSFPGSSNDEQGPQSALVMDSAGNLFGTTFWGGNNNTGSIFELSPSGGSWAETTLYEFPSHLNGLANPGGLLLDGRDGSLYGTALWGDFVYKLSPPEVQGGSWKGTELFTFNGGSDGLEPLYQGGALIADHHGNLYGTTTYGGTYGDGEVFELSPPSAQGEGWTETVLYSFGANATDGIGSTGAVVMDAAGNLYGTTVVGGAHSAGTVWQLSPPAVPGNPWTETILHSLAGGSGDGSAPYAGLVMDKSGNLYGVSYTGGTGSCYFNFPGCGTVFEVSPAGNGVWNETVLYNFQAKNDGFFPYGGLMIDGLGRLYGTTSQGGTYNGGTAFALRP